MNSLFTVPTNGWGGYYAVFYLVAFIVGTFIILYEGYRRRWHLVPWFIVIVWCAALGIIGSKLLVISFGEWNTALHQGCLPVTAEKSYLGGVLGGIIGVFIARRFLRIRYSIIDAFAFALPVGLAIGRLGCLLGGCCFGTPTNLPWAITYPVNSHAYDVHLAKGLIGPNALTSLPVHPTQLYEIVFMFVLVAILWKFRKFLKRPGSLFYLHIVLYSGFRFLEEFVRDGGSTGWGLKTVQWGLLLVILSVSVFLIWRERTWREQPKVIQLPKEILHKNLIAVLVIFIFIFTGKDWFTSLEMITLMIIALPAFSGVVIQLFRCFAKSYLRWAAITTIIASMIFIGSSFDTEAPADTSETSYNNISIAGMFGQYPETCGPTHNYSVGGVGISHTKRVGLFKKYEIGIRGYIGEDRNGGSNRILGVNPYFQADYHWIGLGFGVHAGNLFFDGEYLGGSFFPQVAVRLGPWDKFFIEGRLADHFPGSWPAPLLKFGIGFGLKNEGSLRLGISDAGWYISPYLPIKDRLIINPFIAIGDEETFQIGLTLRFRLGTR